MIGNASRKREVTDLYPLSPDPAVRINQLREDEFRHEQAEMEEYERELALVAKRRATWDSLYRKAGGPRPSWYLPWMIWWIDPKSGRLEVEVGARVELSSTSEGLPAESPIESLV